MKSISLSPAGKQPVRIANYMAVASESKSINRTFIERLCMVLTVVAALVAVVASMAYVLTESRTSLIILCVSAFAAIASLYPVFSNSNANQL